MDFKIKLYIESLKTDSHFFGATVSIDWAVAPFFWGCSTVVVQLSPHFLALTLHRENKKQQFQKGMFNVSSMKFNSLKIW